MPIEICNMMIEAEIEMLEPRAWRMHRPGMDIRERAVNYALAAVARHLIPGCDLLGHLDDQARARLPVDTGDTVSMLGAHVHQLLEAYFFCAYRHVAYRGNWEDRPAPKASDVVLAAANLRFWLANARDQYPPLSDAAVKSWLECDRKLFRMDWSKPGALEHWPPPDEPLPPPPSPAAIKRRDKILRQLFKGRDLPPPDKQ